VAESNTFARSETRLARRATWGRTPLMRFSFVERARSSDAPPLGIGGSAARTREDRSTTSSSPSGDSGATGTCPGEAVITDGGRANDTRLPALGVAGRPRETGGSGREGGGAGAASGSRRLTGDNRAAASGERRAGVSTVDVVGGMETAGRALTVPERERPDNEGRRAGAAS
jgi:hypothetical protein